jgi:NAD(P)-dependent dehydrogenase (short-subunit alcohol dehydrogenase family)
MSTPRFDGARAVVTGAAGGIGAALATELLGRGASVVLADLDPAVTDTASHLGNRAHAWVGDVSTVDGIGQLVSLADDRLGGVDLYFANAGIIGPAMLGESDADWDPIIDVNMRAHIRAAQALVPRWQEAGSGHFVATASAAGLLTQIGSAAYSVTKHASVGFAEWLAMTYRDDGIRASVICPMGGQHRTARCRRGRRRCRTAGGHRGRDRARTRAGGRHRPRCRRAGGFPHPSPPRGA